MYTTLFAVQSAWLQWVAACAHNWFYVSENVWTTLCVCVCVCACMCVCACVHTRVRVLEYLIAGCVCVCMCMCVCVYVCIYVCVYMCMCVCVCVCVCVCKCVCVCNLLNRSSVFDGNLCPCYTCSLFFLFFSFWRCNCYVVCHAILLIFMYVLCVFASVPPPPPPPPPPPSNPFPPLFHVIYCKRLGLLRLGVSIHNNNNNNIFD